MKTSRLIVGGMAAVSLLAFADCQAEDAGKQKTASKQAAKAHDYANRQDNKDGPADIGAASSTTAAGVKEGEQKPLLDSQVVDKAAQDTGDAWKKMDKMLDRF